VRQV
jgi:DNA repair exonuclease SbcCD ATPase subunit